jgi:hypothetical protein
VPDVPSSVTSTAVPEGSVTYSGTLVGLSAPTSVQLDVEGQLTAVKYAPENGAGTSVGTLGVDAFADLSMSGTTTARELRMSARPTKERSGLDWYVTRALVALFKVYPCSVRSTGMVRSNFKSMTKSS